MDTIAGQGSVGRRECDLVMKGGITSGVIYPRLVAVLSKVYTFRSIGGTSAGAIAAAAAAAAQLGVKAGTNPDAFTQLEQLPRTLGEPVSAGAGSMLLNLFQPQPTLQRHFALLTAALNAPSRARLGWRLCIAAIRRFPLGALLGAIPGLILLIHSWGLGVLLSLALIAIGLVVGAAWAAVRSFGRELPGNAFGMCNGMPAVSGQGPPALTSWLHDYLNGLAGKTSGEPLTFGELWAGKIRAPGEAAPALDGGVDNRVIHLAMMTTALNLSRPYRIPFESGDIYFVEQELSKLFPEKVSSWLVAHARQSGTADALSSTGSRLRALPAPEDFPVLLGLRLSLSFPILLSALPLYTVDRTLDVNKAVPRKATRVYFSDGGISSNFPVHFFDSPLPTRPTFGVNLRAFHPDHPGERVWLPEMLRNNQGLKNYVPALADGPGLGSILAFVGAILDTMQNWRDHLQLAMPGFRDRVVHISHLDEEGGLNLNMPPPVIATLGQSGADAAEKLIGAFAAGGGLDHPNAWDNHLRIRARTTLCLLQQHFQKIANALEKQRLPSYEEVVRNADPPSYPFATTELADEALRLLDDLDGLAGALQARAVNLCEGAPHPSPELRAVPRV